MTYERLVIIFLSLQITFVSYMWMRTEKQLSFVQGQMSVCNAAVDMAIETGENPYVKKIR